MPSLRLDPIFPGQIQERHSSGGRESNLMVKIGTVIPEPKGAFSAAFVLPVTRDGRVLLTKEKRGQVAKYGMLGGKAKPDETDLQCMAREAKGETGGALSLITVSRIADGRGVLDGAKVYYENAKSWACKHDLVVPADLDVDTRFDPSKAAGQRSGRRATIQKKKRAKTQTQQLGIEFVPIESVRDCRWRGEHMHHAASVMCARLVKAGN